MHTGPHTRMWMYICTHASTPGTTAPQRQGKELMQTPEALHIICRSWAHFAPGQGMPAREHIRQHGDATPPGGPAALALNDTKSGRVRETECESERESECACVRARDEDAQSGRGAAGEREGLQRAGVCLPALAPPTKPRVELCICGAGTRSLQRKKHIRDHRADLHPRGSLSPPSVRAPTVLASYSKSPNKSTAGRESAHEEGARKRKGVPRMCCIIRCSTLASRHTNINMGAVLRDASAICRSRAHFAPGQGTPVREHIRQHSDATPPGGPAALAVNDTKSGRARETECESERESECACVRAREREGGSGRARGLADSRFPPARTGTSYEASSRSVYTRRNGFPWRF